MKEAIISNVSEWSNTAGLNNDSPPDGAPEGMAANSFNDTMREMMAAVSRWFDDVQGSLSSGGTGNNYTVTTNNGNTALTDQSMLVFKADRASTDVSALTLNVDGLGAKTLNSNSAIDLNQPIVVVYNETDDNYERIGGGEFDVGTRMLFPQTAAPSGWDKDTTAILDNAAIRTVTGTAGDGGGDGFTVVFSSSKNTDDTALGTPQVPTANVWSTIDDVGNGLNAGNTVARAGGQTASGHLHVMPDMNLKYNDFIIAVKA